MCYFFFRQTREHDTHGNVEGEADSEGLHAAKTDYSKDNNHKKPFSKTTYIGAALQNVYQTWKQIENVKHRTKPLARWNMRELKYNRLRKVRTQSRAPLHAIKLRLGENLCFKRTFVRENLS